MIAFGGALGTVQPPTNAKITPVDAFTIDTKADDGMPAAGNWIANQAGSGAVIGNAAGCTTSASNSDYTGSYRTSLTGILCSFFIITGS